MFTFAIRTVNLTDLSAIREIYNYYVLRSTCTYQLEEETESERLQWFHERNPKHPAIVAEIDIDAQPKVIGWASLSPWKSRAGYARTVEASVYVHFEYQRKGIGRALILDLITRARNAGHHVLIGGASADQVASIAIQKSLGFEEVAHFRETGHKFGQWLDVIYTQLIL